jgi:predicted HTH transcriptional regulator
MEKTKLTKQQAEALEKAHAMYRPDEIVVIHVEDGLEVPNNCLNELTLNTLIRALYIGYEVELTEQEKIQELWNYKGQLFLGNSPYKTGILDTLKILGREDLIPKEDDQNECN